MPKTVDRRAIRCECLAELDILLSRHSFSDELKSDLVRLLESYVNSPVHTLSAVQGIEPVVQPFSHYIGRDSHGVITRRYHAISASYHFQYCGETTKARVATQFNHPSPYRTSKKREVFVVSFLSACLRGQPNATAPEKAEAKIDAEVIKWKAEIDHKATARDKSEERAKSLTKALGFPVESCGTKFKIMAQENGIGGADVVFRSFGSKIQVLRVDPMLRVDQFREILRSINDK